MQIFFSLIFYIVDYFIKSGKLLEYFLSYGHTGKPASIMSNNEMLGTQGFRSVCFMQFCENAIMI